MASTYHNTSLLAAALRVSSATEGVPETEGVINNIDPVVSHHSSSQAVTPIPMEQHITRASSEDQSSEYELANSDWPNQTSFPSLENEVFVALNNAPGATETRWEPIPLPMDVSAVERGQTSPRPIVNSYTNRSDLPENLSNPVQVS